MRRRAPCRVERSPCRPRGATEWLEAVRVYDKSFEMTDDGRKLIDKPGSGPIWSQNYDLVMGRPIFGDKEQTIHDDVNDISIGRRNGYQRKQYLQG
jgi:PelA/Pel-15E family pectate lyase